MPRIDTMSLGDNQTNCYIVWEDGGRACVLIDPGYEPEVILRRVAELGLEVAAVALTHGHFDHVGGVPQIAERTRCPVWIGEADFVRPTNPVLAYLFPLRKGASLPVSFYRPGEPLLAAGLTFTVYETPGHTAGSVCLKCGSALFTGDTLFRGSHGRTDLPGGSRAAMGQSLEFLKNLEFSGSFYPGHGPGGDFSLEKQDNVYLRGNI